MRLHNLFHLPMGLQAVLFSVLYFGASVWAYSMLGQ
jgi:hypothetical protein